MFIQAEHLSDWQIHEIATSAMGHHNYAKYARLYLQKVQEMAEQFPWLYQQFTERCAVCVMIRVTMGRPVDGLSH